MAVTDRTSTHQSPLACPAWSSAGGLYSLAPDADTNDISDQLSARLDHLQAMLCLACAQEFQEWNESIRQNFLWACSSIANECQSLNKVRSGLSSSESVEVAHG